MTDQAPTLGVFGSWRPAPGSPFYEHATECARSAAASGFTIVTGGYSGIMDAAAKGAAETGGRSLGFLCPEVSRDIKPSRYLTSDVMCDDYVSRVMRTLQTCDAFLFFPGRLGTAAELIFSLELVAKGIKRPPLLLWGSYWRALVSELAVTIGNDALPGTPPSLESFLREVNHVDEVSAALALTSSSGVRP